MVNKYLTSFPAKYLILQFLDETLQEAYRMMTIIKHLVSQGQEETLIN